MTQLKSNSHSGNPGAESFRYTLPKYITTVGLRTAIQHLHISYERYGKHGGENRMDYVTDLLCHILPHLDKFICEHFVTIYEYPVPSDTQAQDGADNPQISRQGVPNKSTQTEEGRIEDNQNENNCKTCGTITTTLESVQNQLHVLNETVNGIVSSTKGSKSANQTTTDEAQIVSDASTEKDQHCNESNSLTIDDKLRDYKARHQLLRASMVTQNAHSTDVLIVGDSMVKDINPSRLSRRPVKCKTFRGARIGEVCDIVYEQAIQQNAEEVILHLGSNDVTSHDADEIVAKLESLAEQIVKLTPAKKISASTIINRRGESASDFEKVRSVNEMLKLPANRRRWGVVDNENITPDTHLAADGVHSKATEYVYWHRISSHIFEDPALRFIVTSFHQPLFLFLIRLV